MSTQEDILMPRAKQKRMRMQQSAKPVDQADMTYVSADGDPNNAVLQSVDDNAGQRIQGVKDMPINPQTIDVQGKGIVPTYGQRQVPQATPLPTAAPTPQQAQATPQQLVTSKTGVVQVPKGQPIAVQDNGKVTDMVKDKDLTYNDMLSMLTDQKAEEEKRIKREKQAARIATIGQGLSSLANLYYTTKGAPNAFTPELSERMRTKYDQLTKERTANDRAFLQNYITMLERQRNDARIKQRNEITNNYYKTKGELEAEKQRQEAALKQQAQEFAQKNAQDKHEETKRHNMAMEQNADNRNKISEKRTAKMNGGKSGKGNEYYCYDNEGNLHYFPNRTMWKQAVDYYSKLANIPQTEESKSENVSNDGFGGQKSSQTSRVVNRSSESKGADLQRNAQGKQSAMGGVSIHASGGKQSRTGNTGKISVHKKK